MITKKIINFSNIIFSGLVLCSCSLAPKYNQPNLDLPEDVVFDDDIYEKYATKEWWKIFNDDVLNRLENEALQYNKDLESSIARIDEARAAAGIAYADFWPTVGLSAQYSRTSISKNTYMMKAFDHMGGGSNQIIDNNQNNYTLGAQISYELDLFAKIKNSNDAAVHNLLATKAAADTMYIAITASVAKLYFSLIALDEKLEIAKKTLKSRDETLSIYEKRFENGYCTELDLLRVRAEKSSVESVVFNTETQLAQAETALSVILGKSPREIVNSSNARGVKLSNIDILDVIPRNVTSELMYRRPDIKQAEMQLMAANANIGVARSYFFPVISLTGSNGYEGVDFKDLGSSFSNTWSFVPKITLPIFNAGKVKYNIEAAKAKYAQAESFYKKTVMNAFKEAKDAIVMNVQNRKILAASIDQKNALKKSYELATKQKDTGYIGLVDLLDVERNLLSAELNETNAKLNLLNSVVDLCKALGGGWKSSDHFDKNLNKKENNPKN